MFGMFLSWLTGGGINALASAYAKHKDSAIESERIAAGVAKSRLDAALEAQRLAGQVRLATAAHWEMRVITFAIGACFTAHACSVIADSLPWFGHVPGSWRIPALPHPFDEWEGAIILSFYGLGAATTAIRAGAAALLARGAAGRG